MAQKPILREKMYARALRASPNVEYSRACPKQRPDIAARNLVKGFYYVKAAL